MDFTNLLTNIVDSINVQNGMLAYAIVIGAKTVVGMLSYAKRGLFDWKELVSKTIDDAKYPVISGGIWGVSFVLGNEPTLFGLFQLITATFITLNVYRALKLLGIGINATPESIQKDLVAQFSDLNDEEQINVADTINSNLANGDNTIVKSIPIDESQFENGDDLAGEVVNPLEVNQNIEVTNPFESDVISDVKDTKENI